MGHHGDTLVARRETFFALSHRVEQLAIWQVGPSSPSIHFPLEIRLIELLLGVLKERGNYGDIFLECDISGS